MGDSTIKEWSDGAVRLSFLSENLNVGHSTRGHLSYRGDRLLNSMTLNQKSCSAGQLKHPTNSFPWCTCMGLHTQILFLFSGQYQHGFCKACIIDFKIWRHFGIIIHTTWNVEDLSYTYEGALYKQCSPWVIE